MTNPACRVAIVDGQEMIGRAVASLLSATPGLEVVGIASGLAQAVDLLSRARVDVVVCDTQLGDESGLYLLARYRGRRPTFVMYSSDDHPVYHRAALMGGAAAFVLKTAPPAELVAAIRSAVAGQTHFPSSSLRSAQSVGEVPSVRELAVLGQLARGLSSAEIANALGIARGTVDAHLHNLFGRARVRSRTALVLHAIREGWIRPRTSTFGVTRPVNRQQTEWLVDSVALGASRRKRRWSKNYSRRPP